MNWRVPLVAGKRTVRHVVFDTNFWKSFVHARLAVPMGDPGCLSLFGRTRRSPQATRRGEVVGGAAACEQHRLLGAPACDQHRLLADHLTAEYRVKTEGRGRTVDEWKLRAAGMDNHWFDCLVGCAVAASMQGASIPGVLPPQPKAERRSINLKEYFAPLLNAPPPRRW